MGIWVLLILIVVTGVATIVAIQSARRRSLMAKYWDAEIVGRIMQKQIWQGQTEEQLVDSLGRPAEMDHRVLKSKTTDTWKYHREGKNRFRLRVVVENGQVVGWDKKS